ncbi:MAG: OmpA family protein [Cytophagales bacterium]|nr:MAG: OmpA family protein [Cytophagales bacterium]
MKTIYTIFIFLVHFLFSFHLIGQDNPTETMALVTFKITDYNGIPEEGAVITLTGVDTTLTAKGVADIDGKYKLLLPEGKKYKISVFKFGEDFNFERPLDIPSTVGAIKFQKDLKIKLVTEYLKIYKLEHVYFDFDKWELKKESDNALNMLLKDLKNKPNMKIEIAGHTDDKGTHEYNMRLSQRRADSVIEWLINHGISTTRLLAKGYGETAPVASNDTEEGCSKNRRTEVRIIEE